MRRRPVFDEGQGVGVLLACRLAGLSALETTMRLSTVVRNAARRQETPEASPPPAPVRLGQAMRHPSPARRSAGFPRAWTRSFASL
jgi:hypothetical protein